ncbi:NAD(P)/FAD-dependent oxidoreductase [Tichowtungia aerotolerans]|uniref:FAD-dependent oxidoreductase n=1 Tax=Tichowtungia aerotolerans TaxID=2697043 RepID=A0A6P1MA89_9BACT|nr:FAD-dependent oxidoreductase [Tichowtungia aerotolerans]QHI70847.1 FAD-dependent oxidoreductase [Tichowtungia aerotolerans]
MNSKTVIIGAGFAGRQACRILSRTDTDVILFDPNKFTVMLPSLPDLAGGWVPEKLLIHPLKKIIPRNIQHIQKAVTSINLDEKTVTADHATYPFDFLLIASGSVADFHGFDQHLDAVHKLDSLESALRIRDMFKTYLSCSKAPHLVIAGGGYTGLELAASLRFRSIADGTPSKVTIADPSNQILPFLSQVEHDRITDFLKKNNITVLNQSKVTSFDGQNVDIGDQMIEKAFFCWAGGSKLSIPEIKGSVSQLRDGRITVQPDLSLPNYPNVFAAGDSAAIMQHGQPLRKAINFAWYSGARAGKNIASCLKKRPTKPFKPIDLGWVIPLHTQSTGKLFSLLPVHGRPGLRLHYFMCGLRNFNIVNFIGFTKISLKLFKKERST